MSSLTRAALLLGVCALAGCLEQRASTLETTDDGVGPDRQVTDGAPPARPEAGALDDGAHPADAEAHPADAGADAGPDPIDAGPTDAAPPDAEPADDAAVDPIAEPSHFIDRGRCFEHTPRCGEDADCDPALYRGCVGGRCQLDTPCGCVADADCADGDVCLSNERVCGACAPAPTRCPDGACRGGDVCVDGWCRAECPGHGDGPPLDCRGEPPIGRCDGRWAYLRGAGTCVPVDAVGCVEGRNTFESRRGCVERCRGPAPCTVTLDRRVGDTARRRVECVISHGPGACVALAHCLCELDDPAEGPEVREQRRLCAFSWSVPRGAITFADYCGRGALTDVVDRMRGDGFVEAVFGPETEVALSPGCAEVDTDQSVGPMCQDGQQNGWESGVDCGPQGCPACPP